MNKEKIVKKNQEKNHKNMGYDGQHAPGPAKG